MSLSSAERGAVALPALSSVRTSSLRSGCIELIGLCGAGKSKLIGRLLAVLAERGHDLEAAYPLDVGLVPSAREAVRVACATGWSEPRAAIRLASRRQGLHFLLKLGLRVRAIRRRAAPPGTLLVDSGVLQPFVSYYIEQNLSRFDLPMATLLGVLPLPDLVVYVCAQPDLAFARYVAREQCPTRGPDAQALRRRFDDGFAICEWLKAYLEHARTQVLTIDSSHEPSVAELSALVEAVAGLRSVT